MIDTERCAVCEAELDSTTVELVGTDADGNEDGDPSLFAHHDCLTVLVLSQVAIGELPVDAIPGELDIPEAVIDAITGGDR